MYNLETYSIEFISKYYITNLKIEKYRKRDKIHLGVVLSGGLVVPCCPKPTLAGLNSLSEAT